MDTFRILIIIIFWSGASLWAKSDLQNQSSKDGAWFLESIRAVENAVSKSGRTKVVVAIVDDGMRVTHHDLLQFIWTNPQEIPGNHIDDDGNGYTDDVHGWDAADDDGDVIPPRGRLGDYYHGTHNAGIIVQIARRVYGPAAAEYIRIMPVKALSDQAVNTYLKDSYKGVEYAIKAGADVILCAWGVGHILPEEERLFEKAQRQGIECEEAC